MFLGTNGVVYGGPYRGLLNRVYPFGDVRAWVKKKYIKKGFWL